MRRSARIHRQSPPPPPRAPTPDLDEKYPDDEEKHSQTDEPAPAPLETLAIVCANPPPPRPRKKRGKYKPRLTTEQRTEIVHMWVNEGRSKLEEAGVKCVHIWGLEDEILAVAKAGHGRGGDDGN